MYSVFRYDPPSVGFAELSDVAVRISQDDNVPVPTPTIGVVQAQVTASGINGASEALSIRILPTLLPTVLALILALWS